MELLERRPVVRRTVRALFDLTLRGRAVLSLCDRLVRPPGPGCTTGVRRRPLGLACFAVVGPFHRRIVPAMLRRASRRGWTSRG